MKEVKKKQKLMSENRQTAALSCAVLLTRFSVALNKLSIWSGAGLLFEGDLKETAENTSHLGNQINKQIRNK